MTKVKAICFDLDGVVFTKRREFFSTRFSEEFGVPIESVLKFFKNEYKQVMIGKADMKIELQKYLPEWGYNGSVDELLKWWFEAENTIDQEVLELVKRLRESGYKLYLMSDHSKWRADNLWDDVGFKKYFDGAYFSGYLGYTKEEKEFFEAVKKDLQDKNQVEANEIFFVDDDEKNVEVAKGVGINAITFAGVENLKSELQKFGVDINGEQANALKIQNK